MRVVQRKLTTFAAIPPPPQRKTFHERVLREILQERVAALRGRRNPRAVKRKMSNFALRQRHVKPPPPIDLAKAIRDT